MEAKYRKKRTLKRSGWSIKSKRICISPVKTLPRLIIIKTQEFNKCKVIKKTSRKKQVQWSLNSLPNPKNPYKITRLISQRSSCPLCWTDYQQDIPSNFNPKFRNALQQDLQIKQPRSQCLRKNLWTQESQIKYFICSIKGSARLWFEPNAFGQEQKIAKCQVHRLS